MMIRNAVKKEQGDNTMRKRGEKSFVAISGSPMAWTRWQVEE
jgi:hypothetical protein